MPTRAQKAQAFKTWQVFLEGTGSVVRKVRKDVADGDSPCRFHLAETGEFVATLTLQDAWWFPTVPFS